MAWIYSSHSRMSSALFVVEDDELEVTDFEEEEEELSATPRRRFAEMQYGVDDEEVDDGDE